MSQAARGGIGARPADAFSQSSVSARYSDSHTSPSGSGFSRSGSDSYSRLGAGSADNSRGGSTVQSSAASSYVGGLTETRDAKQALPASRYL